MEKKQLREAPIVEVSRPTGPRVIAPPPRRQGYLERYVPHGFLSQVKNTAVAAYAVFKRPKVLAVSSSIALAIAVHLAASSITTGFQHVFQASLLLTGVGPDAAPVAATFTGPGDVVSGAYAWWGLRAYSSAKAGTKAINLCDDTGANCVDILTNASTGKLNSPGTLGVNNCNTSGSCVIATFYDQSGSTNCSGVACDITQATNAARPTLLFSCINSLPCAVFSGVANQKLESTSTVASLAATVSMSAVANRTGTFTTAGNILAVGAANAINLNFRQVASAVQMFAGTAGIFASNITDSNFHAFQAVFNGASSNLMCGGSAGTSCSNAGTNNSLSPGSIASDASGKFAIGLNAASANSLTGDITEVGMWNSVFNGTQQTNMNSNQVTFWGPF